MSSLRLCLCNLTFGFHATCDVTESCSICACLQLTVQQTNVKTAFRWRAVNILRINLCRQGQALKESNHENIKYWPLIQKNKVNKYSVCWLVGPDSNISTIAMKPGSHVHDAAEQSLEIFQLGAIKPSQKKKKKKMTTRKGGRWWGRRRSVVGSRRQWLKIWRRTWLDPHVYQSRWFCVCWIIITHSAFFPSFWVTSTLL